MSVISRLSIPAGLVWLFKSSVAVPIHAGNHPSGVPCDYRERARSRVPPVAVSDSRCKRGRIDDDCRTGGRGHSRDDRSRRRGTLAGVPSRHDIRSGPSPMRACRCCSIRARIFTRRRSVSTRGSVRSDPQTSTSAAFRSTTKRIWSCMTSESRASSRRTSTQTSSTARHSTATRIARTPHQSVSGLRYAPRIAAHLT